MCLVNAKPAKDNNLKWETDSKGRKYCRAYKVFNKQIGIPGWDNNRLCAPYHGTFIAKPGFYTSDRTTCSLGSDEKVNKRVYRGIHVFTGHDPKRYSSDDIMTPVSSYYSNPKFISVPVKCYKKDLVATGVLGYNDPGIKDDFGIAEAVFTRVEVTERVWNKIFGKK